MICNTSPSAASPWRTTCSCSCAGTSANNDRTSSAFTSHSSYSTANNSGGLSFHLLISSNRKSSALNSRLIVVYPAGLTYQRVINWPLRLDRTACFMDPHRAHKKEWCSPAADNVLRRGGGGLTGYHA